MRSKFIILALSSALAACNGTIDDPTRGVASINTPVVTAEDYAFDAVAPGGVLPPAEEQRLAAWFRSFQLGYGDSVYVDGYAPAARAQVAAAAGRFGIIISPAAPVTVGAIPSGGVRVVVSRRRASVPGCPNWSRPSAPDTNNQMMSNFGCAMNANLAAMMADPEDLLHGREGSSVTDAAAAARAVDVYRKKPPTGNGELKEANPKGGN